MKRYITNKSKRKQQAAPIIKDVMSLRDVFIQIEGPYMKIKICVLVVFTYFTALQVSANPMESVLPGISLNDSVASVSALLEVRCNELEAIEVGSPSIPVAEITESHLVCSNYRTNSGSEIERISFSFGDDQLKFLAAHGGAVELFTSAAESNPFSIAGIEGYLEESMAVSRQDDTVWLGVMGALRAYIFLWDNPYLSQHERLIQKYNNSVAIPELLKFGDSIKTLSNTFKNKCKVIELIERENIQLLNNPNHETQLNCYGYEYGGFIRTIEAIFGDGILEKAWIITAKEEEGRIRASLVQMFGEPEFVSSEYEAFDNWRVALRKDEPEVLLLSESLAQLYEQNYQR